MKVVSAPLISFRCHQCGATCEGDESEFSTQNTMPPTWRARCAFCGTDSTVSPSALIAKVVGSLSTGDALGYLAARRRGVVPYVPAAVAGARTNYPGAVVPVIPKNRRLP